ncbi:MAG: SDR family oxidoreductase [Prevotellaceae bacterium]|jgi:nucleoside-diphosphate-sugar epimerase|nr:SDR family oxidoreductase [Prevotellaceae bacterium]
MKILFIGGTGTISSAISKKLIELGHELFLLNRGNKNSELQGFTPLIADIKDEKKVAELISDHTFDVVADFIAFKREDLERDYRLFNGKTRQFVFISSASAYQKPPQNQIITESTPLCNPFWQYSRDKIFCEEYLVQLYRNEGFPITIVRPSHTYGNGSVPVSVHGENGSWQVIKRMLDGKKVIIHGDGTSLWTLTHNSDFARAFIGLLGNIHAIGEAIHITSDEVLTWNQIYQQIADTLNVKLDAVHISSETICKNSDFGLLGNLIGDKANCAVFDNTKIKLLVPNFAAATRFDQGVKQTLDYILSHKECQIADERFDRWCDEMVEKVL